MGQLFVFHLLFNPLNVWQMERFFENTGAILLGGSHLNPEDVDHLLAFNLPLYAADAGMVHLDVNRHKPKAVIGDFDSVSPLMCDAFGAEDVLMEDQDRTDFEKALDVIDAPYILCLGFLGGRLDHELAAFNALAKRPEKHAILIGEDSIAFLCPDRFRLELPKGTDIGLFPMSRTRAESEGLKWNLNGLKLSPDGLISTSNKVDGTEVEIMMQTGHLMVIIPREFLPSYLQQVAARGLKEK